jgi:hypothetical protein
LNIKLIILNLLVVCLMTPVSATDGVLIKVPVRVVTKQFDPAESNHGYGYAKELKQLDFQLKINGVEQPVLEFYKKSRAIETYTEGRCFALSFEAAQYGELLAETVTDFIRNTLRSSDRLLVRSPLHIYKIDTSASKDEIIRYIQSNVQKDMQLQQQIKTSALAELGLLIKNIKTKLETKKLGIRSVMLFVSHFSTQWNSYYSQFVSGKKNRFVEIASQLSQTEKGTEKWMIHFLQKGIIPLPEGFTELCDRLKKYAKAMPDVYRDKAEILIEKLDELEASMKTMEHFPMEEITNALLGVNVSFNVMSVDPASAALKLKENSLTRDIRMKLGIIAKRTGGISAVYPNLREGMNAIKKHVDYYYDLVFKLTGPVEDKKLDISIPENSGNAHYKKKFHRNEVQWLMDFLKKGSLEAELSIENYNLNQRKLSFAVSGYRKSRAGEGMVKVDIQLIDQKQEPVYQTGKTLKSSDTTIAISISLPEKYSGYYKLSITTQDLISGQNTEFKQYIKL